MLAADEPRETQLFFTNLNRKGEGLVFKMGASLLNR